MYCLSDGTPQRGLPSAEDPGRVREQIPERREASMRVLFCGGRHFEDRDMLSAALDRLSKDRSFSLVISGGARGADALAEEWAKAVGLLCTGESTP